MADRFDRRQLILAVTALLTGCATRDLVNGAASGRNTPHERQPGPTSAAIAALAETIIPTTDTPGAIEAGVPAFIEMMLSDWCTDEERYTFREGLESLDTACRARGAASFAAATNTQRTLALQHAERAASDASDADGERTPFFTIARELTVVGYYTSRIGATRELRYNPAPGRYADLPFDEVGRQWSF